MPRKQSPVIPEMFGATRSMQNAQVMTTTNSEARYVSNYVTHRDQNNQVTVAPSVHNREHQQQQRLPIYVVYGPSHDRYAQFAMLAVFGALAAEV